ncbi:MAG: tRNA (adenosine(37)-N6)-dimethylallyltransferase MiaA [Flavobacteriales bacterium]|jgi:tRNA dimethylallyltransferase|nr:tRNA (adenosine(37)-N6)-dimethylallyltransferase MiaA [Flavobacteriales bacterium]
MKKPFLVLLTGPTAIGKTNLSVELAKYFGTEILSCDSRQFFEGMSIGTAVPSEKEMQDVKHHFVQHLSLDEHYSVGKFERDALQILEQLFQKKNIAFLVGGSGLYYSALLEGIDDIPPIEQETRDRVELLFAQKGLVGLQELVKEIDPEFWAQVDQQNHRRLMRPIEMYWQTGKNLSYYQKNKKAKERPFSVLKIALQREREELYERINHRVDLMMEEGLENEVRELINHQHRQALQTVGYKEFFDFFDNKIDRKTCVEKIKQNTRRYAKRQMTWFRRDKEMQFFHPSEKQEIIQFIEKYL